MIRLSAILALACAVLMAAAPAEALEGRLTDRRTGKPIVGAEVAIGGLAGSVRTDRDGRFTWTPDPRPPFLILIVLPGGRLARPVRMATLAGASPLVIQVDATIEEEITVFGAAPSVDAPPGASTTLVSSAEIGRRAPANLMQALENVPGVSSVAEGQSAVPAVRGLARGRTLVLVDGSRLFSERRAGPSVSFLAPESMDRIDVVRGPASVAYGSDAFGGVISVLTRRPSAGAPFAARVAGTTGAGVPARRADVEIATGLGPRGAVLMEARDRDARDYSSPDGVVANSAWQDRGGLVRGVARAGGWWTGSWQGDFVGPSGRPRSDSGTLRVSSPFERSQRGSVSFEQSGLGWVDHLSVSGLVGRYTQRLDQDRLPTSSVARRIDRADIEGTDVQVRALARIGVARGRLTAGADVNERHGLEAHDTAIVFNLAGAVTSTTDNASIASARKHDVGAFAEFALPVASAVTVTAGGRLNAVRSVNVGGFFGDRAVSHRAASGQVAIALRPASGLALTAQASKGFRDPTLSDRFYRGPVGRGFIVGNPDLDPERSVQLDVTARYVRHRWQAGASYYHYDISDLIERYQATSDTFLFRNRGLADIRGVELDATVDLAGGVALGITGQAVRGRAHENGAALDDVPPRSLVLQIRKAFGARVSASARLAAVARDRSPGPSEVATPGYVEAGAAATWRTGRWLELRASGSNLLNRRYDSSPSPRWVLAPGRSGALTAIVKF
jgi:outer membrane receptor protein involved in Fe transport